jgi:hypothetical protein
MSNKQNLKDHLNSNITNSESVNESVILGSIVVAACVGYAASPILNSEFAKSVGSGISGLLNGIGSIFSNITGGFGFGGGQKKIDKVKELLKKDAGDLTQKEKDLLRKVYNKPKFRKNLSDNELKKINNALGISDDSDDSNDSGKMSDKDEKELHSLLKKKKEDLTPKEKKQLNKYMSEYDLSDVLSDSELDKLDNISDSLDNFDDVSPEDKSDAMLALATKANENESDEEKKKKNSAMIDIIAASSYDENGNPLPVEERQKKMKELVGEENWDSFKNELEEMQNSVDKEEFEKEVEKKYKSLSEDEIKEMKESVVTRSKEANEKIAKEKAELADIDNEIEKLQKDSENSMSKSETKEIEDKINQLKEKREKHINDSTLGNISSDINKNKEEFDKQAKNAKEEFDKQVKDANDKKKENIEKKYKEDSDKLANDYQKKIDDEKDPDKKKKLEDEWETKEKELSADKHKKLDEIDDRDEHDTENDATKKGKYKVKEEEVTDPETGKKIKVTTYTGPRGGKFYYPDGKPKTPENKVYVGESIQSKLQKYNNLKHYLLEKLN